MIFLSTSFASWSWFEQARSSAFIVSLRRMCSVSRAFTSCETFAAMTRGFVSHCRVTSSSKRARSIVSRTTPPFPGSRARITEVMSLARSIFPVSERTPRTASKACSPKTP